MIITAYGVDFNVQGDGFTRNNAMDDFSKGVDVIEDYLRRMTASDVHKLHAESLRWVEAQCEGDRPAKLDDIEALAERIATAGWRTPGAAYFSVSATRR